jgi:serine/threonine-protein kinase
MEPTRRGRSLDPSRELLFGLLALQNGLIDQVQLVMAFEAWTRDKNQSLAEQLLVCGSLGAEQRRLLEELVNLHIRTHGGKAETSLSFLPVDGTTRELLVRVGGPAFAATVLHVGSAQGPTDRGGFRSGVDAGDALAAAPRDGQRFRIIRPHACGGLGAVFVALDSELNREVAVKQILERHASEPASRARFLLEAEVTGGLEHPGIVPVYSLGTYADGRPYYAMRFIRGDSLKEAIQRFHARRDGKRDRSQRSLELRNLLRRFTDVCNAVDYAHARGVLHRDIKPGNIIVGKHGETLVVDWGLAKALGTSEAVNDTGERRLVPSTSGASTETLPGSALGTPAYMSPEQAGGEIDRLGPRSDVYGLGATLFCLLTGKAPFEDADIAQMLDAVRNGRFRRPREYDRSIEIPLEAVCLKAMALKPEDRYASPRELAEEIERWAADEPVTAWRDSLVVKLGRWARRHRTLIFGAGFSLTTAVLLLSALIVMVGREQRRTTQALGQAEANYQDARNAVDDYLTAVSEVVLRNEPGMEPLRKKLLQSALAYHRTFLERHGRDPRRVTEVAQSHMRLARIDAASGRMEESAAGFARSIALYAELVRRNPSNFDLQLELAACHEHNASARVGYGKAREAEAECDQSITILNALMRARPNDARPRRHLGQTLYTKAQLKQSEAKFRESADLFGQAIDLQETVVAQDPERPTHREALALYCSESCECMITAGRADQAMRNCRRSLALLERLSRENPRVQVYRYHQGVAQSTLGFLQERAGVRADAIQAYENAVSIHTELSRENPSVARYRRGLAWAELRLGELYLFGSQAAIRRLDPGVAKPGDAARGVAALRRAFDLNQQLFREEPTNPETLSELGKSSTSLGEVEFAAGRFQEAERAFRQASALGEESIRRAPDDLITRGLVGETYARFAEALLRLGRSKEAAAAFGKALESLTVIFGPNPDDSHARTFYYSWSVGLALTQEAQGKAADAAVIIDRLRSSAGRDPDASYELACAFSRHVDRAVKESGPAAQQAAPVSQLHADRAMQFLREAVRAGYRDVNAIQTEPDLDPLRYRSDFRDLVHDLSFPVEPFAR